MKKMLFVFLSVLSVSFSYAQKFETVLDTLSARNPAEKIYIHYDKEYYVAGESIWFKAYLYNNDKPDGLSNNLFLQFTDSKGKIVLNKKYPVTGAVAKGNIDLPDTLGQGNYYIRALTPGMMNNEEAFIYKKNIFVFRPAASSGPIAPSNVSVQFFPESGQLVDGILTVVAFKATDQWGAPADISGTIKTADGTTITSFKTFHDGIGKVQFKPQSGKKYMAEVITPAGPKTYSLPDVQNSGFSLKVQDEKGGKKFQLSRAAKDKSILDNAVLVAQINNHIVYENEIAFEDYPSVIGHIVTDSLPSGILHFTVFNKDGVPVAERLSFIDNGEYRSAASIDVTKTGMGKREENSFEINFPGTIQRSCSVSITDFSGNSLQDNDNIWSRLLLTSDLKGYVYNPAWYFMNQNDSTRQALDNLMLTHGWSRFSWKKILNGEFPQKSSGDKNFITVAGTVTDDKNNPVNGGKLNLLLQAEDSTDQQSYEVTVNPQGRFNIDSMIFYGKSKLFYAYTDSKGKTGHALVKADTDEQEEEMLKTPADFLLDNILRNTAALQNKNELNNRFRYVQSKLDEVKELERVTVSAKKNKRPFDAVNEKYTTGVFRSEGKENIDNINDPVNDKSMNAVDFIKNRVPQLEIQGGGFVNRKNLSLQTGQKWAVGIFLNEVPANIGFLRNVRAMDIALVKFYEAGFVGVGSSFPGGAVAVYTKERFMDEVQPDKLEYFVYNGYSITREFYSPDYNNPETRKAATDNRTTLYWNPDVFTDGDTKSVKLKFFNNDFSKKVKVILEGFDADGKLIHAEKVIGE